MKLKLSSLAGVGNKEKEKNWSTLVSGSEENIILKK